MTATSLVGKWHHQPGYVFGPDTQSYVRAMNFLSGHGLIEDWGCGTGHARTYAAGSPYRGVDGSPGAADVITDLVTYRSDVPCILLRHVLEHNPEWQQVLDNAIASFSRRLALVIYTPLVEQTRIALWSEASVLGEPVPEIWFSDADLLRPLRHLTGQLERIKNNTPYQGERLFLVRRAETD